MQIWLPVILLVEIVLIATNYTHGTYLYGWDNVLPELNFAENLSRNLVSVWQSHRGLGVYDGLSHAANLLHTLFLWLMSLVLPQQMLRWIFHFLMHLIGMIGMYKLLKGRWLGALFYGLNLATIQMFYTPLEAYSVHFASLPWLAFTYLQVLKLGGKKQWFNFLLVMILSTPQFFVTTLIIPITLLLFIISLTNWSKRVWSAAVAFLLVNAFWLLPYLGGLKTNIPVIQTAKINQMGSSEAYQRNRSFGDITNVLQLKGFPLDFEDIDENNHFTYLMQPWREHLARPYVQMISWALVGLTILGLIKIIWKRQTNYYFFIAIWLLGITMLGTELPGISAFHQILREKVPFLGEALRFTFTKFSLLTAFAASGLVALSLDRAGLLTAIAIICLAWPAFRGNFFLSNLKIKLPNEYQQVTDYLNQPENAGRIGYLPAPTYWSWKYYRFGYRGSGFLWYGLKSPLLDLAVTPWSRETENYFWEMTYSLYAKNSQMLKNVLEKYQVRYLILDENLLSPTHNRALFTEEIKELLATTVGIEKKASFGPITVYQNLEIGKAMVFLRENLPEVSPEYQHGDYDAAYQTLGDYITKNAGSLRFAGNAGNEILFFPFRSLSTKKSALEREFNPQEIRKTASLVFDSSFSDDLNQNKVINCGWGGDGTRQQAAEYLRLTDHNSRSCLNFSLGDLTHNLGYLVEVTSRNISGQPLLFALINRTAKHAEIETYLSSHDYFILPPLSPDGRGYHAYFQNLAVGPETSTNDILRIRVYQFPYQELVNLTINNGPTKQSKVLILSQSYHPGWKAYTKDLKEIKEHVKVNNWENGWILPSGISSEIVFFFWPQIWQYLGFFLLPLPLVFLLKKD